MKAAYLLALPILALAQEAKRGDAGAPPAGGEYISVTMYDSPHSSGDSTWIVHTTVSYSVGPGYTKMIMASATSSASTATGTWAAGASGHAGEAGWTSGAASVTGTGWGSSVTTGATGWGSSSVATPTPSAWQYKGDASNAVAGVGAIAMAGLALVL